MLLTRIGSDLELNYYIETHAHGQSQHFSIKKSILKNMVLRRFGNELLKYRLVICKSVFT